MHFSQSSTWVNSSAFASGSRVKIAGLPDRLRVYGIPAYTIRHWHKIMQFLWYYMSQNLYRWWKKREKCYQLYQGYLSASTRPELRGKHACLGHHVQVVRLRGQDLEAPLDGSSRNPPTTKHLYKEACYEALPRLFQDLILSRRQLVNPFFFNSQLSVVEMVRINKSVDKTMKKWHT